MIRKLLTLDPTLDREVLLVEKNKRGGKKMRDETRPDELARQKDCTIRYEADTKRLYIKIKTMNELLALPGTGEQIVTSRSFLGQKTINFHANTGLPAHTQLCYAFDLNAPIASREFNTEIPTYVDKRHARMLVKKYGKDMTRVSEEMDKWRAKYLMKKMRGDEMGVQELTPEQVEINKLKQQIRNLKATVRGGKPKEKRKRKSEIMPELDAFIAEMNANIYKYKAVRKLGEPAQEKRYDPSAHNLATVGKYDDIQTPLNHSKKLAIMVSALKASVPDYRYDRRYTHSQKVKIRFSPEARLAKGYDQDYCAIFDLTRK